MDEQKMRYHLSRLKPGEVYWDNEYEELVEFGYMGQTGLAIVYKPGDSGGGMQSSWAIDPDNLEKIVSKNTQLN